MSVILNPDKTLTFSRPFTQAVRRDLHVQNPNASPVVFKVKTTAPKQYSVRPNAGIIEPNSSVTVAIHFQPMKEELAADAKCKDKFLVQSAYIPPSIPLDNPDLRPQPQEIWAKIEGNRTPENIYSSKIRCAYAPLDENGASGVTAQHDPSSLSHKPSAPASNALLTPAQQDLSRNEGTLRKRKQVAEEALSGADLDRSMASAYESPMSSNYNTNTGNSLSSKMQHSSAPGSPGSTIGGGNNLNTSSATTTALNSAVPSTAATAGSQSPKYGSSNGTGNAESEILQLRQELSHAQSELARLRSVKSSTSTSSADGGHSPAFKQAVVAAHPSSAEGVPVQVVAAIVLGVFILTWLVTP